MIRRFSQAKEGFLVGSPTKGQVAHRPFDASKYLGDIEAQAAALSDALESGHKGVILNILNAIARARGMTALAKASGIKRETLYAALADEANPTLDTFLAVINALGIALRAETRTEVAEEPELEHA
jgi:probable addiction module antidote protein